MVVWHLANVAVRQNGGWRPYQSKYHCDTGKMSLLDASSSSDDEDYNVNAEDDFGDVSDNEPSEAMDALEAALSGDEPNLITTEDEDVETDQESSASVVEHAVQSVAISGSVSIDGSLSVLYSKGPKQEVNAAIIPSDTKAAIESGLSPKNFAQAKDEDGKWTRIWIKNNAALQDADKVPEAQKITADEEELLITTFVRTLLAERSKLTEPVELAKKTKKLVNALIKGAVEGTAPNVPKWLSSERELMLGPPGSSQFLSPQTLAQVAARQEQTKGKAKRRRPDSKLETLRKKVKTSGEAVTTSSKTTQSPKKPPAKDKQAKLNLAPTPKPAPKPAPKPVPEPVPEQVPEPAPAPVPAPVPVVVRKPSEQKKAAIDAPPATGSKPSESNTKNVTYNFFIMNGSEDTNTVLTKILGASM